MRRALCFFLVSLCVILLTGCGQATNKTDPLASIKTYKDIPGVTTEEITAIEALKAGRGAFSYGALLSTEAFVLPDGSYAGFVTEFCRLLSELFGVDVLQQFFEWDELIYALDSQTVDFTGELTPTAERQLIYGMTSPIAERMLRIFTLADSDVIQTEVDVNGLTIGFLEDTVTADSIHKSYPVTFSCRDIADYHMAAALLQSGEIDAFVEEAVADPAFDEFVFIDSRVFFPMVHASVSMTTADPGLYPVISVVNKYIAAGGIDKLYSLYKEGEMEYARHKLRRLFTDGERAYVDDLAERGAAVSVALEHDNYPVSFYNETEKEFQGLALDVLAEISRLTGISFEAATSKTGIWADIIEDVRAGKIQMAAELLKAYSKDEDFLWSSAPYSKSYYAIMSRADYPNLVSYQVARAAVGVMRGSGHAQMYRELFPDNHNTKEYDTQVACLDALEKGEVDLLMASEHMLLTQIHYREKPGFKVNIKLNAAMDSYFGFPKGETILCSIINKAQQYVDTDAIEISWTGRAFDYSKKLAEERAFFMSLLIAMLLLILVATVFLFRKNVKLSKKMEELACNDELTGLFNRRHFIELSLAQADRSLRLGSECFIIITDLDHFKAVNDTYGHLAGDKVLRETAQRIKKAIRPYDLFARYGGEEFIALIPDITRENVMKVAERIRQCVQSAAVDYEGKEILITISLGIAQATPKNNIDMATKYADTALYRAKEMGRNQAVSYEEE